MRVKLLIPLIFMAIFIGCGDNEKSTVAINNIEKSITKEKTNLGCGKEHNGSEECSEEEKSSAEFILNTLEKGLDSNEKEDIASIKKNLNTSLDVITKEEDKNSKLKDSLIALVNEVNEGKEEKKRDLKNFVNSLDDNEIGVDNIKKIASIKNELTNLVELDTSDVKSKDVKKRLQHLIDDVTESKKSLSQTQKSLKTLVENVEKKNTPSAKKFASAIIKDVSNKKISILKETNKYFIIKVQSGDNLSILAKRYYNDKNKFRLIYEANRDKINSKYEIYPNSRLLIPKI